MIDELWSLPGPRSFVSRCVADLHGGTSVVVHLPPHAPGGLGEAVRSGCDGEYYRWVDVGDDVDDGTVAGIVASLQQHVGGGKSELGLPAALAQRASDTIFWVSERPHRNWPVWARFLEQFRQASHELDEADRGVFCVHVPSGMKVPEFEIGLTIRCWRGIVQEVDVRLLAELLRAESSSQSDVYRSLKCTLLAELGGSDLQLLRTLSQCSLEELISPAGTLEKYLDDNKWLRHATDDWASGAVDDYRSEEFVHSAILVRDGDLKSVERRIWRAQLTCLFPLLEQRRIALLPAVERHLRGGNLRSFQGEELAVEDLELGQLVHFLRGKRVPSSIWQELLVLREVRHALAHLRTVPHDLVQCLLTHCQRR